MVYGREGRVVSRSFIFGVVDELFEFACEPPSFEKLFNLLTTQRNVAAEMIKGHKSLFLNFQKLFENSHSFTEIKLQ